MSQMLIAVLNIGRRHHGGILPDEGNEEKRFRYFRSAVGNPAIKLSSDSFILLE